MSPRPYTVGRAARLLSVCLRHTRCSVTQARSSCDKDQDGSWRWGRSPRAGRRRAVVTPDDTLGGRGCESPAPTRKLREIQSPAQGHTANSGRSTVQPCPQGGAALSPSPLGLPSGSPPLGPGDHRVPLVPLQLHQRLRLFHPVANSVQRVPRS